MVFNKANRLTKRNGYAQITDLPEEANYLTTFDGNLTAVGTSLQAFAAGANNWVNKGSLQPVSLTTLPLIRSNTTQTQADAVVSPNNFVCTVYTDTGSGSTVYKYAVADSNTGQNILPPAIIPTAAMQTTAPRVFLLGSWFVIVFGTATALEFCRINIYNPVAPTTATQITSQFAPDSRLNWDGAIANNQLYIAWNGSDVGGAIRITYLDATLVQHGTTVTTGQTANIMSIAADISGSTANLYVTWWNATNNNGYTAAYNHALIQFLAPTQIWSSTIITNIATSANNNLLTVYYEIPNNYGYDSSVPTHYIETVTCTSTGTVGTPSVFIRSVGLASKASIINNEIYLMGVYFSPTQPTYFLLNAQAQVVSELAYSNGGGYRITGLPALNISGNNLQTAYQYADLVQAVNKSQGLAAPFGVYSQTGCNLVTFTIGTLPESAEIGNTMSLTGGFLWTYDGVAPVENDFFLWPDSVEGTPMNSGGSMDSIQYYYQVIYSWPDNQGNPYRSAPSIPILVDMTTGNPSFTQPTPLTPTAAFTQGQFTMVVSSATGLMVGQTVTDTTTPGSIANFTFITKIAGTTITVNNAFLGTSTTDSLSIATLNSVTLHIPTLRLTYKTNVKIEIYRWSTAQQSYYEITSVAMPLFNNPAVDYITYTDTQADNQILGNALIYTTGGVLEDTAAPGFNALSLFDSRLWGIDAEDPNKLWYSKQVIENTPVEMSDLLTLYISPSIGSQGSTGRTLCIFPMDDKLIIFKENAMYYINGTGPDNTGANSTYSEPIFISGTVGCANQNSIVLINAGLMFQSDKGIWLLPTGPGQPQYIGAPVEDFTLGATVLSAVNVPMTTQVRFTMNTGITLMYDYFFQQWGVFVGVGATSSTIYEQLHTYLDQYGRVFQETPGLYLDGSVPVLQAFSTGWIASAGLIGFQRAYWLNLLGTYFSPHKLNVQVAYDYNPNPQQSTIVQPPNYAGPWGSLPTWGAGQSWGGTPYTNVERARVFFDKQKCTAFQIIIDEVFDSTYGTQAGEGLTLSGMNLTIGVKKSYPTPSAERSYGS